MGICDSCDGDDQKQQCPLLSSTVWGGVSDKRHDWGDLRELTCVTLTDRLISSDLVAGHAKSGAVIGQPTSAMVLFQDTSGSCGPFPRLII